MDGLTLLIRAQEAGLTVRAEGDKLVMRGPRQAEPVVRLLVEHKAVVMAALAGSTTAAPDAWVALYQRSVADFRGVHDDAQARRMAWARTASAWHLAHGVRAPEWQCAGCGTPLSGEDALKLPDGCRVHLAGDLTCVIAYGKLWRGAAAEALASMGIPTPADEDADVE